MIGAVHGWNLALRAGWLERAAIRSGRVWFKILLAAQDFCENRHSLFRIPL